MSPPIVTPDGQDAIVERPASPQRRNFLIAGGAIAALVVLVFVIRFLAYSTAHQTTDDAQIDADQVDATSKISERVSAILVDTNQPVKRGQLLLQLDDRDERARLAQAQANVRVAAAQAQAAEANVTLTRDTQRAQDQESAGQIAQAQAGINSAGSSAQSQQDQIAADQAALDATRAQLRAAQAGVPGAYQMMLKAQADLRRTQSLVATGDLAQAQLDAARASYQAAVSGYRQAQANAGAAAADVGQSQQKLVAQQSTFNSSAAQIGVEQGTLVTAQGKLAESSAPSRIGAQQAQANAVDAQTGIYAAQLKTAQDQLSYTQIRSPIDGYVGAKNVEVGRTVQPGESLMTIIPSQGVYITSNYKETQLGNMRVGQQVDIGVDAYKGVKFTGHVQAIAPAAQNKFSLVPPQNATGNFVKVTQRVPVRILFDNPDPKYPLRPGMSVETSVKVK
jgi:membrane fusion protein (multidrug efflux system)